MSSNNMEYLDVLDERGRKIGQKLSKKEVHEKSLWHLSVNLWVITPDHKIFLCKRSKNKDAYPGHWAHAAAGHVSAGETSIEGTIREAEEEIGIVFKPSDLEKLFSYSEEEISDSKKVTHRSHFDAYLTCCEIDLDNININYDEVEEAKLFSLDELIQMTKVEGLMLPFPYEYPEAIKILKKRFKEQDKK